MISPRLLLIFLLIFVITGALIYGFLPKPIPVETTQVSRKQFQVIIEEEGKTRLKDRFLISAPVSGTLYRPGWDIGDEVQAGQKLCEIAPLKSVLLDPRSKADAEDRVAAAKASLRTAKSKIAAHAADAEYAQSEYKRIKQVYDKKLISRNEFERAETEKRRANANLESSHFAAESARYSLSEVQNALSHFAAKGGEMEGEKVFISSPVNGQVLTIYQESEGMIRAGQMLMEIGNIQGLEVVVEVLSTDAVRIQPGMSVEFDRWGGEQTLTGRVLVIEPIGFTKVSALGVEEQRVRIIVAITSPENQWGRLGDGYRVDTRFILWQGQDILQIPENALFRYDDGWAVFVVRMDNYVELRVVKPGKRSGLHAQIIEGLSEGETIIIHPDEQLENGLKVSR